MRPAPGTLIRRALAAPTAKAAMRERNEKLWSDPATRARISAGLKAAWADPEIRARRVEAIRRAKRDGEARSRVSKSMQIRWGGNKITRAVGAIFAEAFFASRDPSTRVDLAGSVCDRAAFEAALAACAIALKLTLRKARKGNASTAAGQARTIATYLAVTFFGVSRYRLAAARDVDRRRLRRSCHRVEELRSDAAFDALVSGIEARLA